MKPPTASMAKAISVSGSRVRRAALDCEGLALDGRVARTGRGLAPVCGLLLA